MVSSACYSVRSTRFSHHHSPPPTRLHYPPLAPCRLKPQQRRTLGTALFCSARTVTIYTFMCCCRRSLVRMVTICAQQSSTNTAQCNLGRAASQNPSYNGTPQFTPKSARSPSTVTIPSNTPIPRPTPLIVPNGTRIHSAVLPQCILHTDRPTDRQSDGRVPSHKPLTLA